MKRIERLYILALLAAMPAWTAGVLAQTTRLATRPATELATGPATGPAAQPTSRSATAPTTRPATRPATKPAVVENVLGPANLFAAAAVYQPDVPNPSQGEVLARLTGKPFAASGILGEIPQPPHPYGRRRVLWAAVGPIKTTSTARPTREISVNKDGTVRKSSGLTAGTLRHYQAGIRIEFASIAEGSPNGTLGQAMEISGEINAVTFHGKDDDWPSPTTGEMVYPDSQRPHVVLYLGNCRIKKVGP